MNRKRILVTGAAGRLGTALVVHLGERHDVVALDHALPGEEVCRAASRVCVGSVLSLADLYSAMEGIDTVVHAAAIPSDIPASGRVVETNVLGTFLTLEAAGARDSVERFIFISSMMWFGLTGHRWDKIQPDYLPLDEGHPSRACMPYGCSKVQGELWCKAYATRFGKPAVALRPGLIISSRRQQTAAAMPFRDKAPLAEYVGADDVADAVERSIDYHPADGFDTFVLSAEDQFSTRPTLDIIAEFAPGARVDREALAACDGFAAMVNTRHARETLGWRPSYRLARPVPEPVS